MVDHVVVDTLPGEAIDFGIVDFRVDLACPS